MIATAYATPRARARQALPARTAPTVPAHRPPAILRQTACACGGRCPKCEAEAQAKRAVSEPGDPLEREADAVADKVLRMAEPGSGGSPPAGSRGRDGSPGGADGSAIATSRASSWTTDATPGADTALRVAGAGGVPLPRDVREFFEPRFGRDLGGVRVHTGGEADAGARAVRARAYTVGRDIVFGRGEYAPASAGGRRLLAHELAHVVQQGADAETSTPGVLQRYAHEDCTDADLRTHIWPADGIAKRMVRASIAAVTASPVAATTEALFAKYFMSRTPDTARIAEVFRALKTAFDGDSYTYECEEDCDAGTNAYSGWAWDIHLCMNNLRGRANECIARTIIHEFSHKYAGTGHGWIFSTASCYNGCDTAGCPASLSPSDALDNAYSYAGFAYEV